MDDKSVQVGGQQRIVTIDGSSMPLVCKGGLMYLQLQGIPTDQDLQNYPSVHLTSPHEWDPSVLDYEHPENNGEPAWAIDPNENFQFDPNFDEFGDYVNRSLSILDILEETPKISPIHNLLVNKHVFQRAPVDYEKLRPFFGWVNSDIVKQTIDRTTQWGVALDSFPMKRHLKSRNPALNVPRRHEPVATDTIFSDTPAVDSGVKQAQVFVGRDSLVADVYPMKSGEQFVNTLEDNIRRRGAMDKLLSDSAKTEIFKKVMDILRAYHISNWHSEPYHQNQNPAEWRYRTIKSWTNTAMNRSGAPANCWLLCMIYVCYILNHIACGALNGSIPLLVLYGITPDISIMLLYTFYQPVFYATHDQHFPSESEERAAYWVGFGEHCGDAMTHKLLDKITQKIIHRSAVRPLTKSNPNHRLTEDGGEASTSKQPSSKVPTVFIRSRQDDADPSHIKPMPEFDPDDLIGRTFLLPPQENGERLRAKVTKKVVEQIEAENANRIPNINFILDIGEGKVEELITYNQLLDHLEQAEEEDNFMDQELYKFRAIIGHEGPLKATDPNWKGSKWNVQIEWETDEVTFEPLSVIAADDPITCAAYTKEKNLYNLDGWKRFRHLIKKEKQLTGKRWAETLHDILIDMDFIPSRADQCIWLKKNEKLNIYEYIAVYVDDLCIAAKDPKEIINVLKSKYHLKVKGDGPLTYHLGADYFQDPDGTMVSQPKKHIEKLKDTYIRLFNTEPSKGLKTPLEKNDHPELDTSEILEGQEVNHYLTMVGQLQWLITLGRFDIQSQVITMSRFRAQPRKGHLDRLKRIYAYVIRTKDYATRFRTKEPDYSYLPDQNFDWAHTVYGNVQEIIPDDIPDPLGKSVTTTRMQT